MKAMLLAAGRGERMRPLTDTCPKPLLEFAGHSLIERLIEQLATAGIRELVINLAWLGDLLERRLGDGARWNVSIRYAHEPEGTLETAGGIRAALPLLGDQPFVALAADIRTDYPFAELTLPRERLAHLVMVTNPPHHPSGDFALADGLLAAHGQPRLTFSGIGVYRPEFFARLTPGRAPLAPLLIKAMASSTVSGEHYRGVWHDVGTPERLAALRASLER